MIRVLEWEIGKPSSNCGRGCYLHFHTNTLTKNINPSLLPASLASLTMFGKQYRRRKNLYSKLYVILVEGAYNWNVINFPSEDLNYKPHVGSLWMLKKQIGLSCQVKDEKSLQFILWLQVKRAIRSIFVPPSSSNR